MDLHWDYNYYQPWGDNKWLIQEMIDNNIIDDGINIDDRVGVTNFIWPYLHQFFDNSHSLNVS